MKLPYTRFEEPRLVKNDSVKDTCTFTPGRNRQPYNTWKVPLSAASFPT